MRGLSNPRIVRHLLPSLMTRIVVKLTRASVKIDLIRQVIGERTSPCDLIIYS